MAAMTQLWPHHLFDVQWMGAWHSQPGASQERKDPSRMMPHHWATCCRADQSSLTPPHIQHRALSVAQGTPIPCAHIHLYSRLLGCGPVLRGGLNSATAHTRACWPPQLIEAVKEAFGLQAAPGKHAQRALAAHSSPESRQQCGRHARGPQASHRAAPPAAAAAAAAA